VNSPVKAVTADRREDMAPRGDGAIRTVVRKVVAMVIRAVDFPVNKVVSVDKAVTADRREDTARGDGAIRTADGRAAAAMAANLVVACPARAIMEVTRRTAVAMAARCRREDTVEMNRAVYRVAMAAAMEETKAVPAGQVHKVDTAAVTRVALAASRAASSAARECRAAIGADSRAMAEAREVMVVPREDTADRRGIPAAVGRPAVNTVIKTVAGPRVEACRRISKKVERKVPVAANRGSARELLPAPVKNRPAIPVTKPLKGESPQPVRINPEDEE